MKKIKIEILDESQGRVNLIFQDVDNDAILDKALSLSSEQILEMIRESGLRGRGGAGFPTSSKWQFAANVDAAKKTIICNADEGEPGTFKDREILERQLEKMLVGMIICARAVGGTDGFIYIRGEYTFLLADMRRRVEMFNRKLKDRGLDLKIEIISGAGAYICGEETALIESMEGRRGEPRNKPPFPTVSGYLETPTVVNNVETLVYASMIISEGPSYFKSIGTRDSRGAKVFSVSGDCDYPGIYELELGMTIENFVELFSDGDAKAVQVGGSSGHCVPRKKFKDTIIGFEGMPTGGSMMIFNSSRSMYNVLHNYLEFFVEESCGQCTPCRVGCQQLLKGIEAVKKGEKNVEYLQELRELAETMRLSAKCGLGQSVANPFVSILDNFKEEIVY